VEVPVALGRALALTVGRSDQDVAVEVGTAVGAGDADGTTIGGGLAAITAGGLDACEGADSGRSTSSRAAAATATATRSKPTIARGPFRDLGVGGSGAEASTAARPSVA
jgi:hypothetical protein